MSELENSFDDFDSTALKSETIGAEPQHIDFVISDAELQEENAKGTKEKIVLTEKSLDEIVRSTQFKEERINTAQSAESAVELLKEIDIGKKDIGTELFTLEQRISEMEKIQAAILDIDLTKRFASVVESFQKVLIAGRQSQIADKGIFGFGRVKNRGAFSDAIDSAVIQAATITSIY